MRGQRADHILNITSMGGLLTFPSVDIYNTTKFAMEALRQEIQEFGIKVTEIEPGLFETDWSGRSQQRGPESIQDYHGLRKRRASQQIDWNGDLQEAAKAMLAIAEDANPPRHLLLGSLADELVSSKLTSLTMKFDQYRSLSRSTDIDA